MKKEDLHSNKKAGFSSVEVLLAIALFSMVVLSLSGALVFSVQGNADASLQSKAVFLAEEALEATRLIRGDSLSNLVDGDYGLALSGNTWVYSGSSDAVDTFTRQVTISTIDASTKQIEATVDWASSLGQARTVTLSMYLTDWQLEGAGEEPPPPSIGDWSMASVTYSHNMSGTQNGETVALDSANNVLYASNLYGSPDFVSYDVTTPTSPVELDSLDAPDGVNRIRLSDNGYAFLATRGSASELVIYDVSDPSNLTHRATLDITGALSANRIDVSSTSNEVALVRQFDGTLHEVYMINTTTKTAPTVAWSLDSGGGHGYTVTILAGSPAYLLLGTSSWSNDFQVIDTTAPQAVVETFNINDQLSCRAVHIYAPNRVAVGCGTGAVHLLDITDPTNVSEVGTFDIGTGEIFEIDSGNNGDYLFVVGKTTDNEFAVLDISNEASISLVTSIDMNTEVNDVVYDSVNDIVYFASDLDTAEWGIIEPG